MTTTGTVIPSTSPDPNHTYPSGSPPTGSASVTTYVTPRITLIVPRVMMNDGIPSATASQPLSAPTPADAASPAHTAGATGQPDSAASRAERQPASAISAPTERSISPAMITNVI